MAIITDKTVISKYAPDYTNVTWIDTSCRPVVIRAFINGKWVAVCGDIGDESDDGGDSGGGSGGEGGGGDSGDGGETTPVQTAVSVTYSELRSLRDEHKLIPGMWYRITDYVCTTTQQNTQSANHSFDIIVRADDERRLNDNAYATRHSGDTHFANCKLTAWRLKYDLDNDTNYFTWADDTNGKGVVYWMVDEFGNECPYDFKNIMFKRFEITAVKDTQNNEISGHDLIGLWGLSTQKVSVDNETSKWFYTFSSVNNGTVSDASLSCNYGIVVGQGEFGASNNVIDSLGEGKKQLNNIVFINNEGDLVCFGNGFRHDCSDMTFGDWCFYNTFGSGCNRNMSGSTFQSNRFGNSCEDNVFGDNCSDNTFMDECCCNTFDSGCFYNTFHGGCCENTFDDRCSNSIFGNCCEHNVFADECDNMNVFADVSYCNVTGGVNCHILNGTSGSSASSMLNITFTDNSNGVQFAGFNTLGVLKVWNPADSVQ